MLLPIKNKDLFDRTVEGYDALYVVSKPPKLMEGNIKVNIDLDEDAAVLDSCTDSHPYQGLSVSEVRSGKSGGWLLSGGAIIYDHVGRIAVGMRDGNAADPFAYTNIAAGRCDHKFQDHCYEELASEFVLCVKKDNNGWEQINFGKATIALDRVREERPAIAKWKKQIAAPTLQDEVLYPHICTDLPEMTTLIVHWEEKKKCRYTEQLQGFMFVDKKNHTVEFRLPVKIDLSRYDATEIFFAEGTGYATWMFPAQIRELHNQVRHDGSRTITPFLEWIVGTFT